MSIEGKTTSNLCSCGSGKYSEVQYDGHGIYLTRTCEDCYQEKMKGFRADIFTKYEADEAIDEDY